MIDPMMFLHAETHVGEPEVRIAIKVGLKLCKDALGEIRKPKEDAND